MAAGVATLTLATFAAGWRLAHHPAVAGMQRSRELPEPGDRIRVEVLNGSRITGLARSMTRRLRDGGLDVVYFGGDSTSSLDSTLVLVRQGDAAQGERVRRVLGFGVVRAEPDPSRLVDVSVRLGRDGAGLVHNP